MGINLSDVHVGDTVHVHNRTANIAVPEGTFHFPVVEEDDRSLAVDGLMGGKWWFYRDIGESYTGDAAVTDYTKGAVHG